MTLSRTAVRRPAGVEPEMAWRSFRESRCARGSWAYSEPPAIARLRRRYTSDPADAEVSVDVGQGFSPAGKQP
jgi:hypothetical protein